MLSFEMLSFEMLSFEMLSFEMSTFDISNFELFLITSFGSLDKYSKNCYMRKRSLF
jgi:hypothetical protein